MIFQPHLLPELEILPRDSLLAYQLADEVILLDIYPARELPIEGVTSEMILRDINLENKSISSKEDLIENIAGGFSTAHYWSR